jgi:RNA polymerase sigma-70 factor (ECF subfamily)
MDQEPSPDARHVARLRAGDPVARRWAYERFSGMAHGLLVARLGPDLAEDLTQEVFLRLFRSAQDLGPAESLPAWIATIARNLATDHLRRRGRRPRAEPLSDVDEPQARPTGDAGAEDELRRTVLAHIRSLPEAYGETLVLRLVEGLTGPEIADRTGLTPGSVRVNLCRGMALLRPLLAKDGWS